MDIGFLISYLLRCSLKRQVKRMFYWKSRRLMNVRTNLEHKMIYDGSLGWVARHREWDLALERRLWKRRGKCGRRPQNQESEKVKQAKGNGKKRKTESKDLNDPWCCFWGLGCGIWCGRGIKNFRWTEEKVQWM